MTKQIEYTELEFKSCTSQVSTSVYETICAFLNKHGGYILLGVDDDGTILGVNRNAVKNMMSTITSSLNNLNFFSPTVGITPELVEVDGKLMRMDLSAIEHWNVSIIDECIDQLLSKYAMDHQIDKVNAKREVMQQVTLAGLYRGGFFDKAAFYGGTCLRIFHGLERYSEDMDFSLVQQDEQFHLEDYFDAVVTEFHALGSEVIISKEEQGSLTNIESAFLKTNTSVYNVSFSTEKSISKSR